MLFWKNENPTLPGSNVAPERIGARRHRVKNLFRDRSLCRNRHHVKRRERIAMEQCRTASSNRVQAGWRAWVLAARPKTLWASVAPVVMGTALAAGDGRLHLLSAAVAFWCALLIQVGTNFANDYFDYLHGADSADRLGPTRATQAGLIPPHAMKRAFVLVFAVVFVCGLYLVWRGGWPILLIGLLSILFGILYTGGPFPLGYLGLGDVFVLIFFGPVAVGGTYYVQAQSMNSTVLVAGLAPGLLSTALLTVNNLRDVVTDRRAGKRTLAVRFGEGFARVEYLLCIFLACAIPLWLYWRHPERPAVLLALLALPMAWPAIRTVFREKPGPVFNQVLAHTGRLLLVFSILFSMGWVL